MRLTPEKRTEILGLIQSKVPDEEILKKYEISKSSLWRIKKAVTPKDVQRKKRRYQFLKKKRRAVRAKKKILLKKLRKSPQQKPKKSLLKVPALISKARSLKQNL